MALANYIRITEFVRYDGTNGAEVAAYMGRSVVSDTGTVLRVSPAMPISVATTFQLGDAFSLKVGFVAKADFEAQYVSQASLTPGADHVGTMDAVSVSVPLLLLGGSVERAVVWNRPFPDTSYKVTFLPDANTLGKITPTVKSGTKTTSGLTVVIAAGLAVSVAGVLHVVGTT